MNGYFGVRSSSVTVMIISFKLLSISILLFAGVAQCSLRNEEEIEIKHSTNLTKSYLELDNKTDSNKTLHLKKHKYSSKIAGSRFSTDNEFGIRIFPIKSNLVNEVEQIKNIITTTENVLDFRISNVKKIKAKVQEKDDRDNKKKDMATASAGGGKQKKEADDDEEKTLAQQVADGKYGLIQNEIFANGSKRPGILSYASNTEVPKDTKENFGGLEKDEIWLAEDHILVLRGGNYQNIKENKTLSSPVWPAIDDYKAPNRQVKLPKNSDIPPPFPVQLTEDGPIEFIKGQYRPFANPPITPSLPPFAQESNKTIPFPFPVSSIPPPPPRETNKTFPFPIPPHLPPFLSNLPPGATFVAPPSNQTDIDEDDPSIYYPPKYDFFYSQDNTTAVPPGPLVPGIILPPPPDFFSLLENETDSTSDHYNETDYNINSVTPNSFSGPKYLPANRKPSRPQISSHRYLKRPTTSGNLTNVHNTPESTSKQGKPAVTYVFPEKLKHKSLTSTTPSQNFRENIKVPTNKHFNDLSAPIFVRTNSNQSIYHPLPTTSPKPNHITLPTTKTLPKQIYIITTPETVDKNRIEDIYKNSKPVNIQKYKLISPEIHPLRSLIKPNVTISYNGKYGRLPPATVFPLVKPEDDDTKQIQNYYVTPPTVLKTSKAPSTDINSVTVTPIPVIKKIRVHSVPIEKPKVITPTSNATKATFYFYEEPSTTEQPKSDKKPEALYEHRPKQIGTNFSIRNEIKPTTQFYYTTKSTSNTPIRQFLEETFHSSNVLPQKPQIGHINNAEIIPHNSYSEIQKMKHLSYGTHVSPKPAIKYHYVTEDNAVIIPSFKIKDLEIKNSGSIGLQNVNLDTAITRPAPKPIVVQDATELTRKPETYNSPAPNHEEIPKPILYQNNDGPFIPSNYYATVRPELLHFTSQEQTLVDDITKNYFTIFGQKINSVSTTPLTPIKSSNESNKSKPESGLTYISDRGQNFKIQQVHESSGKKPGKSSTVFYTSEKPKASTQIRPSSNFEKYLKELTGEDQKDYIITGVFPTKIKKSKGFLEPGSAVDRIPPYLLSKGPTAFINGQSPIHQASSAKNTNPGASRPKVPYQPGFSTTLRPVDVDIKPQYIQQLTPTAKPLGVYPELLPHNVGLSQNFQQYLQEITGLTSPTTTRPIRVKNPNVEYFPATPSPLKPLVFQHPSFQVQPETKPKPVSLEGDILVNFKRPRPVINSEAELINIHGPSLPFDVSSNIKVVDSPDLSKNPNQPYSTKQITFGMVKDIFQNLPKSGYFSPPHQTGGNSFVSYNLPGNGGHFYFLTPQIVQKENYERQNQDLAYKRVNRGENKSNEFSRNSEPSGHFIEVKHGTGFSSHDYLQRSKKKT